MYLLRNRMPKQTIATSLGRAEAGRLETDVDRDGADDHQQARDGGAVEEADHLLGPVHLGDDPLRAGRGDERDRVVEAGDGGARDAVGVRLLVIHGQQLALAGDQLRLQPQLLVGLQLVQFLAGEVADRAVRELALVDLHVRVHHLLAERGGIAVGLGVLAHEHADEGLHLFGGRLHRLRLRDHDRLAVADGGAAAHDDLLAGQADERVGGDRLLVHIGHGRGPCCRRRGSCRPFPRRGRVRRRRNPSRK